MKIKDTLPLIFAVVIGGIANIGDLFTNIILPIKEKFSVNQIGFFILLFILLSACFLIYHVRLSKSKKGTPLKLKVIKYLVITPLSISLILGIGLILPNTINSAFNPSGHTPVSKQTSFEQQKEILKLKIEHARILNELEINKQKNISYKQKNKESKEGMIE